MKIFEIKKIITEEILSYNESFDGQGIGDKFFNKITSSKSNIENTKALSLAQKQDEQPIGNVDGTDIYLNPNNLNYFEDGVRAIGDNEGNLYVAQNNGNFIHGKLAQAIGLTVNEFGIYSKQNYYLLLNRVNKTNSFALSDTSIGYYLNNETIVKKIIEKIKEKNPQYDIIPEVYFKVNKK